MLIRWALFMSLTIGINGCKYLRPMVFLVRRLIFWGDPIDVAVDRMEIFMRFCQTLEKLKSFPATARNWLR